MWGLGIPTVETALPVAEKRQRERNLGRCKLCSSAGRSISVRCPPWQRKFAAYFGETLKEDRSLREDVSFSKENGQVSNPDTPRSRSHGRLRLGDKWRRGQRATR